MHTVVDIIPLLLHASLFFFFAGLVAFLIPINLGHRRSFGHCYRRICAPHPPPPVLFGLPVSDSPLWCILAYLQKGREMWRSWLGPAEDEQNTPHSPPVENMVELMFHIATEESARTLADDSELEPFVEAIPDVIWGPVFRRQYSTYEDHIQRLMRDPDLILQSRIAGLLDSCNSGLLLPEAANRRRIACCKAMWAIAGLQSLGSTRKPLDFSCWSPSLFQPSNDYDHYFIPVATLMGWKDFKNGHTLNLQPATSILKSLQSMIILPIHSVLMNQKIPDYIHGEIDQPSDMIPTFARAIEDISTNTPHRIMFTYFRGLAKLKSVGRCDSDLTAFYICGYVVAVPARRIVVTAPASALTRELPFRNDLETTLDMVMSGHRDVLDHATKGDWTHTIIHDLCSWWKPDQASTPTPLPRALVYYLNHCKSDDALRKLLSREDITLWSAFPTTLANGPSAPPHVYLYVPLEIGVDEVLTALWRMSALEQWGSPGPTVLVESVLEAILKFRTSSITVSVIALLKANILDSLYFDTSEISRFRHSLLPMETAIVISEDFLSSEFEAERSRTDISIELMDDRLIEAKIALLAEFLESFNPNIVPYKGPETVRKIGIVTSRAKIHENHQIRLANSIHGVTGVGKILVSMQRHGAAWDLGTASNCFERVAERV
ncbi:hypothetical protein C8R44DRAFT_737539 [Mycena epipterygia]|nr:hypothetical protein C8R44DRAFT_737539 [Mycena epipterygia]